MKYLSEDFIKGLISEKVRLQSLIKHIDGLLDLNEESSDDPVFKVKSKKLSKNDLKAIIEEVFIDANKGFTRQELTNKVMALYPKTKSAALIRFLNVLTASNYLIANKSNYRTIYKLNDQEKT